MRPNINHKAYAHGVLDGYTKGSYKNQYDPHDMPDEHHAYKIGYDYGVFLYCQKIDGDEE